MDDIRFHYSETAKTMSANSLLASVVEAVKRDAISTGISEAEMIESRHFFLTEVGIPLHDENGKALPWQLRESLLIARLTNLNQS